jgi:prefoldin subunit 5
MSKTAYSIEDLDAELASLEQLRQQATVKLAEVTSEFNQIIGAIRAIHGMKMALNGKEAKDGDNDSPGDEA